MRDGLADVPTGPAGTRVGGEVVRADEQLHGGPTMEADYCPTAEAAVRSDEMATTHFRTAPVVTRMATIVGIETEGGTVLAGDRLRTEDGTVRSRDARHVFDFGGVGAAAVGESGAVEEFRRRLDSEVQAYETESDEPMRIDRLATIASNFGGTDFEAIVTARNDEGRARVRGIESGGGIVVEDALAFGSGAQFALGVLESHDPASSPDEAEELAREAIETAADRDTGTGDDVDTYRLANDGSSH